MNNIKGQISSSHEAQLACNYIYDLNCKKNFVHVFVKHLKIMKLARHQQWLVCISIDIPFYSIKLRNTLCKNNFLKKYKISP